MKRFNLLVALFLFCAALTACAESTPESTTKEMLTEACEGDVEGFYSHVDEEAVKKDLKQKFFNKAELNKEELEPTNEEEAQLKKELDQWVNESIKSMINTGLAGFKQEVANGKSGEICTLEIISAKNDEVKVKGANTKQTTWTYKKEKDKWMLVSI